MLGSNLDSKGYIKEIKRLEKNLGAIAKNIERRGKLAFQYLPNKLRELEQEHPKSLNDMSKSELRSYYRQLVDISEKKSSKVWGAIKVQESFGDVAQRLGNLTEEQKATVFKLYGKAYEFDIGLGQQYKYEILEVATDIAEKYSKKESNYAFEELLFLFEELEQKQADLGEEQYRNELLQIIDKFRQFYL